MNRARILTVFTPYAVVGVIYLVAQYLQADEVTDFVKPLLARRFARNPRLMRHLL